MKRFLILALLSAIIGGCNQSSQASAAPQTSNRQLRIVKLSSNVSDFEFFANCTTDDIIVEVNGASSLTPIAVETATTENTVRYTVMQACGNA